MPVPLPFAALSSLLSLSRGYTSVLRRLIAMLLLAGYLLIGVDLEQGYAQNVTRVPIISTVAGNGTACASGSITGCGEGGPATLAELNLPGAHVEAGGDLYISSPANNVIWKVGSSGILVRVAGTGTAGYRGDGGAATSAQLNTPHGPGRDSSGNLYVVDTGNNVVRRIDTNGIITTLAGNGTVCAVPTGPAACGDGGAAANAEFHQPLGITFDSSGNIFIGDELDYRIRKISTDGTISTVLGTGVSGYTPDGALATNTQIGLVASVEVDRAGNLYYADFTYNVIRKVDASGIVTTIAGIAGAPGYSPDGTPALTAQLNSPHSPIHDSAGNLYFADAGNNVIRMIDVGTGNLRTLVGSGTQCAASTESCGDGGAATSAQLNFPVTVSIDNQGDFYIADYLDNRVRKVVNGPAPLFSVPVGGYSSEIVGLSFNTTMTLPSLQLTFDDSYLVPIDACDPSVSAPTICRWWVHFAPTRVGPRWGSLVVADDIGQKYSFGLAGWGFAPATAFTPGRITSIAGDGTMNFSGDGGPASRAQLYNPVSVAVDSAGNVFIAENGGADDYRIRKIDAGGIITTVAGSGPPGYFGDGGPATSAQLYYPSGITVDSAGNLYIADTDNSRIRKVDANGIISTVAGGGTGCRQGFDPWGDGCPADQVRLYNPVSVMSDPGRNLFIVDYASSRLLKVDWAGILTTVAGSAPLGAGYNGDGIPATIAQLNYPRSVAQDRAGNLYIADTNNYRIRKVDIYGTIITVAGIGSPGYAPDGSVAALSSIGHPFSVALDAAGAIYFADIDNLLIRKIDNMGLLTTIAGGGTGCAEQTDSVGDGCFATKAQFSENGLQAFALDNAANLYIVDSFHNRVRKVNVADPPSLVFPDTMVGSTSAAQQVRIDNVGTTDLIINGITTPAFFSIGGAGTSCNPNGQLLAPAGSCILSIQFAPQAIGNIAGDIRIMDNALNTSSTQLIHVAGQSPQQPQTIIFPAPGPQIYGVGSLTLTATSTSGLPVTYTVLSGPAIVSASTLTISGAGVVTVQANQGGNAAWAPAIPVTVTIVVTPAVLTIVADNKSMGAGSRVPPLTASYFGFVNGDTTAILTNTPIVHTDATSTSGAGTYDITIAQGSLWSANYSFNFVGGKLTINPDALNFFNNFFVTGDYAAGTTSLADGAGTITMGSIPAGAQFVAAFLYWQTLEQPASAPASLIQFRDYPVMGGQQLGSDLPFTHRGISGVVRTYRANVLPYLPVDNAGLSNATVNVRMPSGWVNESRHAIGATLLVVYRVLSNQRDSSTGQYGFPLKAVVIYDGSWAPPDSGMHMFQSLRGFDSTPGPVSLTVVSNDSVNWNQQQPEYPMLSGDHVNVDVSSVAAAGMVVMSTPLNADPDGLLASWKAQQGYYDARDGVSWVALPGATVGQQDMFVQIDYMCSQVLDDGTCDTQNGHSHLPSLATLQNVAKAFEDHGIQVHFDVGNNYQGQPHIVPSRFARGGNIIPEQACTDVPGANPPSCVVPNEAGMIGWKMGLGLIKMAARNSNACASGGDCSPRFEHGRKDSYHYVVFGHSVVSPAWSFSNGYLTSVSISGNTATITTSIPQGLAGSASPRITISEAISQPYLNGIYVPTIIDDYSFRIPVSNVSGTIDKSTDPGLSIYSGRPGSSSGFSDVGGADSVITLGNWKFCLDSAGRITNKCPAESPQNDSIRINVEAGSLMHELGHSIGLTHGGVYYDAPTYLANYEGNCKPNYQSVMNYLFQIDLLGPGHDVLDFSDRGLDLITESEGGNKATWTTAPKYATTSWYSPTAAFTGQTAADIHCDGTAKTPDEEMYRVDKNTSLLAWTPYQDLNFNGKHDDSMRGYDDWSNLNLRQIGATGSHFVSGGVLLVNGGGVVLPNGGGILLPNGGGVLRPDGGVILPNGGGVLLPNGGGVLLPNGGGVLLPDGGVVLPNGGGVLLPNGGGVVLPNGGGTVWSGANGVVLPNGGGVLLPNGGGVLLPNGGGVILPNGGGVLLANGGGVVLPNGGGVLLPNGGGIVLPNGGGVLLPNGGGVVLPNGGGVTLPNGGGVLLPNGGGVVLPDGGVVLANGGGVVLPNGGGVLLPNGGGALLPNGGGVLLPNGGGVTLPNGGGVTLPNGGGVLLPNGGGVEMTYETANGFVRPPVSPIKTQSGSDLTIDWTAPNFGVISVYTIYRNDGSVACKVTGNPPPPTCTLTGANLNGTYLITTQVPDERGVLRESAPASVKMAATVTLGLVTLTYTGSALSPTVTTTPPGLTVVFSGAPRTEVGSYSVVATIDNPTYAGSISGTFVIIQASSTVTVTCPAAVAYNGTAQTPCSALVTGAGGLNQLLPVTYSNNINPGVATASASFAGDPNHTASSNTVTFTINQSQASTTTSIAATPNPATFGQPVLLTGTVTPIAPGTAIPTGTITFHDGGTTLSTIPLNTSATATLTVSSLAPGIHQLSTSYSGDTNFRPSSSAALAEQIACGVLLGISPSSVTAGGRINVTASIVSCATAAEKIVVQFSLSGPMQPNKCRRTESVISKTPPFTLPAKTSNTVTFPFTIARETCAGTYSISAATIVNGAVVNTSTASLSISAR
jgi:sugar lactone lactonase YvrE